MGQRPALQWQQELRDNSESLLVYSSMCCCKYFLASSGIFKESHPSPQKHWDASVPLKSLKKSAGVQHLLPITPSEQHRLVINSEPCCYSCIWERTTNFQSSWFANPLVLCLQQQPQFCLNDILLLAFLSCIAQGLAVIDPELETTSQDSQNVLLPAVF